MILNYPTNRTINIIYFFYWSVEHIVYYKLPPYGFFSERLKIFDRFYLGMCQGIPQVKPVE